MFAIAAVSAARGSLNADAGDRNRSAMLHADAFTSLSLGIDSAPADVGEMASAACLS